MATTSAVFDVVTALVTLADTALDVNVYDGFGVTDDPGDYLMIGVEDPDVESAASSAMSRQEWAHANFRARDEEGEITCAALSWNGQGDQQLARETVRDILSDLADAILADPSLGLQSLLWTTFGTDLDLSQAQGDTGASALVIFKVQFRARLNA